MNKLERVECELDGYEKLQKLYKYVSSENGLLDIPSIYIISGINVAIRNCGLEDNITEDGIFDIYKIILNYITTDKGSCIPIASLAYMIVKNYGYIRTNLVSIDYLVDEFMKKHIKPHL